MISLFAKQLSPSVISDWWYGSVGMQTRAGINVTNDTAMTYSAVWACTRVLSASGSSLPFNLHRRSGDFTAIASDHPVHRMLHAMPNDEMGSMGLRSIGLMRQVNKGNFFAEIVRDRLGNPDSLEPIDNDRMTPVRPDASLAREHGLEPGKLAWQIKGTSGYDYMPDRNVFNVRSIISDNGIIGKGVIENARETIAHGLATVHQGAAYMKNSARPSVVISGGKFKDAADRETYRRMWMDVHGGADNNAKPAMLPEGSELKVLSFSPEDSQFIQTMQNTVEDIARWYGVPPHMIQHLLRATFNNVEQMGIDFVVYSLLPWLKMWEEEVYRKLLSPIEQQTYFAKHNVTALLRGDSAARAAYYQSLWQLGAYSINEIRQLEDLNPIDGGDQHFIQTSYTTLDKLSIGEWKDARAKNDVTRDEFRAKVLQLAPSTDKGDAPLLALVGGMTSSIDVARAVGNGELSAEAGAEILQLFLQIEADKATAIAGEKQESDEPPIVPANGSPFPGSEPEPEPDGELSRKIDLLLEYQKQPEVIADPRVTLAQDAIRIYLRDTASRLLTKECKALQQACAKEPREFFAWLDAFYDDHQQKLTEALRQPVQAYVNALGVLADCETITMTIAASHVQISKEAVLLATEVQSAEWPSVSDKMQSLSRQWRQSRCDNVINQVNERVMA